MKPSCFAVPVSSVVSTRAFWIPQGLVRCSQHLYTNRAVRFGTFISQRRLLQQTFSTWKCSALSETETSIPSKAPPVQPVVVVTGSSKGIGRAIALEFAKAGCKVVVNYSRSVSAAELVVSEIIETGAESFAIKADVSSTVEVESMFQQVFERYKGIDVLVNNAGVTQDGLSLRTFLCCQNASKYMLKQRKGRIINMASVVGEIGNAGQVNYAASKAGVIGLTRTLAKEFAPRGVLVNAVAPGFIVSDMTKELDQDKIKQSVPLGRLGTAEEVAGLVAFLALHPSAAYITGHVFNIDGGIAIGLS
ncbi:3-oxoacyl-[acyl-carrier-protein] reductase 3, chloroplastic [Galdieria sulphuraria]|nr:3-oxoacyl-[acyl-carrier-protein] reductase 3, chloroplastic [Galdieria sulphuraria]